MDSLSQILSWIRVVSTKCVVVDCLGPWAVRVNRNSRHVFHYVLEGECSFHMGEEIRSLSRGDVVVGIRSRSYTLSDRRGRQPVPFGEVLNATLEHRRIFRGRTLNARLLCGVFSLDANPPLIDQLPNVYVSSANESMHRILVALAEWLQLGGQSKGEALIRSRIVELILLLSLERYAETHKIPSGLIAGSLDTRMGAVLSAIHRYPEVAYELDDLAAKAKMSRSALTRRFRDLLGQSPIAYLNQWRLARARTLILDSTTPLSAIAGLVGYSSSSTLSRAVKEAFGHSPTELRKSHRQRISLS